MSKPWNTDKWFVSPWNFTKEAMGDLNFPSRIKVHDITLRDGEQQAGLVFNKDDKVRIAEKLAEAGVDRIEAGMPAVSPSDAEAIKEIVKRDLGPEIFAFSRCMVDDVKRAVDCGVKGIVMEVPSSEHIIQYAYKWPLEKAIDTSVKATQYAKEQGLYVVFFPIDFTRAEMTWALDLLERVATEGHMDALAVVDTFGVLGPHAMNYLIKSIRARIKKPLETHFHADFGMAAANTVLALGAGCEVVHTTVLGIGERAGNASFEETALALLTMYGVKLNIDYSKLYELSKLVRECSGQAVPSNRPVIGDMLFDVESGIITSWLVNCGEDRGTELFPFRWDLVGQDPPRAVLGKGSGIDSVNVWLKRVGLSATEAQAMDILTLVKAKSLERKALLTETEFRAIASQVLS